MTIGKKGDCVIPKTLESNVISLHKFLFNDENYTPSDMVKKISAQIASDTGLYKEGKPVGDVGTGGGYTPKETEAKTDEKSTQKDNSESSSSSDTNNESTSAVDESIIDGETDFEYETDEDGNVIDPPEDYIPQTSRHSSESSLHPGETSQAHPGETTKAPHPGESSEGLKLQFQAVLCHLHLLQKRQQQRLQPKQLVLEAVRQQQLHSSALKTAFRKRIQVVRER